MTAKHWLPLNQCRIDYRVCKLHILDSGIINNSDQYDSNMSVCMICGLASQSIA